GVARRQCCLPGADIARQQGGQRARTETERRTDAEQKSAPRHRGVSQLSRAPTCSFKARSARKSAATATNAIGRPLDDEARATEDPWLTGGPSAPPATRPWNQRAGARGGDRA